MRARARLAAPQAQLTARLRALHADLVAAAVGTGERIHVKTLLGCGDGQGPGWWPAHGSECLVWQQLRSDAAVTLRLPELLEWHAAAKPGRAAAAASVVVPGAAGGDAAAAVAPAALASHRLVGSSDGSASGSSAAGLSVVRPAANGTAGAVDAPELERLLRKVFGSTWQPERVLRRAAGFYLARSKPAAASRVAGGGVGRFSCALSELDAHLSSVWPDLWLGRGRPPLAAFLLHPGSRGVFELASGAGAAQQLASLDVAALLRAAAEASELDKGADLFASIRVRSGAARRC